MMVIVQEVEHTSNPINKRSRSRGGILTSASFLDASSLLLMKALTQFHLSNLRRKFGLLLAEVLFNTWLTGTLWENLLAWTYSKSWRIFLYHIKFIGNGYPRISDEEAANRIAKTVASEATVFQVPHTFSELFSITKFKNKSDSLTPPSHSWYCSDPPGSYSRQQNYSSTWDSSCLKTHI